MSPSPRSCLQGQLHYPRFLLSHAWPVEPVRKPQCRIMDSLNPDNLPAPGLPPAGALPAFPKVPHQSSARGRPTVTSLWGSGHSRGTQVLPLHLKISLVSPHPSCNVPLTQRRVPLPDTPHQTSTSLACSSSVFGHPSPSMAILSSALVCKHRFSYANKNPKKEKSGEGSGAGGGIWRQNQRGGHGRDSDQHHWPWGWRQGPYTKVPETGNREEMDFPLGLPESRIALPTPWVLPTESHCGLCPPKLWR